jgi:hypothetical protein
MFGKETDELFNVWIRTERNYSRLLATLVNSRGGRRGGGGNTSYFTGTWQKWTKYIRAWVLNPRTKRTWTEGDLQEGADENIWVKEAGINRGTERYTQRGASYFVWPSPSTIRVTGWGWGGHIESLGTIRNEYNFNCLITGASGRPLWTRKCNFGFLKNKEFPNYLSVYRLIEKDPARWSWLIKFYA